MREKYYNFLNYFSLCLTSVLLISAQTSLWLQVFGHFPPPNLWIPVVAFAGLHRPLREGIIITYLVSFIGGGLTSSSLGVLLGANLATLMGIQFFRSRIFWGGAGYFMLVGGAASLFFPLFYYILSWIFEKSSNIDFAVWDWILRMLMTALACYITYPLFFWIDRITKKSLPTELNRSHE